MIRIDFLFDGGTVRISDVDHYDSDHNFYKGILKNAPVINEQVSDSQYGIRTPHSINIQISDNQDTDDTTWIDRVTSEEIKGVVVKFYRNDTEANALIMLGGTISIGGSDLYFDLEDEVFVISGKITGWSHSDVFSITVSIFENELFETMLPKHVIAADTFTDTALSIGAPINILFGYAIDIPLYNIQNNTGDDEYDYLIGYGTIQGIWENASAGRGIRRDGVLVTTTEYTVYDGSQGSPYSGYAFIRFTTEQRDFSNNFHSLTGDFYGLEMGGATAERNYADVIYQLITNSTWGLGGSANATSFSDAATVLGTNYYCDGYITSDRQAGDVINALLKNIRGSLTKNSSDEYIISIEGTGSSVGSFGSNDGYYENAETVNFSGIHASEIIKSISLKYGTAAGQRYITELSGDVGTVGFIDDSSDNLLIDSSGLKLIYSSTTATIYGVDITEEIDFVEDYNTALRIWSFFKNKASFLENRVQVKFSLEGKDLKQGQIIEYTDPLNNIDEDLFLIKTFSRNSRDNYSALLENYNDAMYDIAELTEPGVIDEPSVTVTGPTTVIWSSDTDYTKFDGVFIFNGTVTADAIAANTITASEIAAGTITATEIAVGTITATEIAASTITADRIITVNGGQVTTGAVTSVSGDTILELDDDYLLLGTGASTIFFGNISTGAKVTSASVGNMSIASGSAANAATMSVSTSVGATINGGLYDIVFSTTSGDDIILTSGDAIQLDATGLINIDSDTTIELDSGTDMTFNVGDDLDINVTDNITIDAGGSIGIDAVDNLNLAGKNSVVELTTDVIRLYPGNDGEGLELEDKGTYMLMQGTATSTDAYWWQTARRCYYGYYNYINVNHITVNTTHNVPDIFDDLEMLKNLKMKKDKINHNENRLDVETGMLIVDAKSMPKFLTNYEALKKEHNHFTGEDFTNEEFEQFLEDNEDWNDRYGLELGGYTQLTARALVQLDNIVNQQGDLITNLQNKIITLENAGGTL